MSKFLPVFIFSISLAFFCLFAVPEVSGADCTNVLLSGNYEVTSSCAFSGDVNGVEEGNLIIAEDQTLTINGGQIIVFNPGQRVTVNGKLAIEKGGRLSVGYIWLKDVDQDGYPATTTMAGRNTPGENWHRRGHFIEAYGARKESWTYVDDIIHEKCDGVASGEVGTEMTALSCTVGTSCSHVSVLRMWATDNAHAGLPAQSTYGQIVCCQGGPDLAVTTSTVDEIPDTVLRLSDTDNAHVEKKTQANYANPAILTISRSEGRILCTYETSCSSPYTCVASISGDINAQIGNCSAYATKVCCANLCP